MSRSDIPDWIRLACNRWGRQKRRIWSGRDWHGNIDGYAESLLGRIRDEREGTWQGGVPAQKWPEVFWGDGLDVQRSLLGMAERCFYALHFHYVWDPEWNVTVARKSRYLGTNKDEYFSLVGRGETWIHARLETSGAHLDSQLVERVNEIIQSALTGTRRKDKKAHRGESVLRDTSDLNLAALNRSKLTIAR